MHRNTTYILTSILIVIASVILFILISGLINPIPRYVSGQMMQQHSSILLFWENQIKRYGGAKAYDRFSVAIQSVDEVEKHTYAHVFGEALYTVEGPAGFGACDTRFLSGCYHQFLGMAIAYLGSASINEFSKKCSEKQSVGLPGCSHGMGHAFLTLFGYTQTDVEEALHMCDSNFTKDNGWYGCVEGVIMEYNLRDMNTGGVKSASTARALTTDNRYSPCASLPEKYQRECAFELPLWWHTTNDTRLNKDFAIESGAFCDKLSDALHAGCIEGIGYLLPPISTTTSTIIEICGEATTNETSKLECLFSAARSYYLDHPKTPLICTDFDLTTNETSECESYATFKNKPAS